MGYRLKDPPPEPKRVRFSQVALHDAVLAIPEGLYIGANRYDTDDQHVLHLWNDEGESFDIEVPRHDPREFCGDDSWDSRYRCVKPKGHPVTGPGLTDHDYKPKPVSR